MRPRSSKGRCQPFGSIHLYLTLLRKPSHGRLSLSRLDARSERIRDRRIATMQRVVEQIATVRCRHFFSPLSPNRCLSSWERAWRWREAVGQPLTTNVEIIASVGRSVANIPFQTRPLMYPRRERSVSCVSKISSIAASLPSRDPANASADALDHLKLHHYGAM